MNLVRYLGITGARKTEHRGPCAGGTFWALEGCNDLPGIDKTMPLADALQNGKLWMQNAERPGDWQEIMSADDLPEFEKVIKDDYEACCLYALYVPYLPEFYWVPNPKHCPVCGSENYIFAEGDMALCHDCNYYKDFRL